MCGCLFCARDCKKMLKIGIIGCGSITRYRHAPEYSANKHVKIKGFYDINSGRTAEMQAFFGGIAYDSIDAMLAESEIDAVSICTSNNTHAVITMKALEAGKHVLCEKPMALSVNDCDLMIEASEKAGRILMIAHNQRFVPSHIRAKQIILSGRLGKVIGFRTTFGHKGPDTWSIEKGSGIWFYKRSAAGFGVMVDLGIHKVDLISWLLDDRFCEVTAVIGTLDKKNDKGDFIEVDDNAFCILKTGKGITGILTASWTNYGNEDNSTVIYCTEGIIEIFNDPIHPLILTMKDGAKEYYDSVAIQTNEKQINSGVIDSFVNCILTEGVPEITGIDGRESLRIVQACYESAARRMTITI